MSKKAKIEFQYENPQASSVAIAGSFNRWQPAEGAMKKNKKGQWRCKLLLPYGRHEYRLVVDGRWISDPSARESVPNEFGETNSVLMLVDEDVEQAPPVPEPKKIKGARLLRAEDDAALHAKQAQSGTDTKKFKHWLSPLRGR